jgi:hypothetical protein
MIVDALAGPSAAPSCSPVSLPAILPVPGPDALDALDPTFRAELKRLWKLLCPLVDRVDVWRTDAWGRGPFRQNPRANPYPIQLKNGLRRRRTLTLRAFADHVMGRRAMLAVNRDGAARVLLRVDVDHKRPDDGTNPARDGRPSDAAVAYARTVNLTHFGGRGLVGPSRRNGASIYLLIDLTTVPLEGRAAWVRDLGAALVGHCWPGPNGERVEAVKGGRHPTVDNPRFDPSLAAEHVLTRPWPVDGSQPRPQAAYLYRRGDEHAYLQPRADAYAFYTTHYEGRLFHRCEALEPRTEPRFDAHSTILIPCVRPAHGSGGVGDGGCTGDGEAAVLRSQHDAVRRCAGWLERSVPLVPNDLARLMGERLPERSVRPTIDRLSQRSSAQAREAARQQDERIRQLLAMGDEDDYEEAQAAQRDASGRGGGRPLLTPRLWRMLRSHDKLQQTDAVAFLTLRTTGGRMDEDLAHRYYDQHVAAGRPCDAARRTRLRHALRWGAKRYVDPGGADGRRRGSIALGHRGAEAIVDAFERHRAAATQTEGVVARATAIEHFSDAHVAAVINGLKRLGVGSADLGTSTYAGVAICYLTAAKNQRLWERGAVPAAVVDRQVAQAVALREHGFGGAQVREGVPMPARAFGGMLRHWRRRTSGRAVGDAIDLLVRVGALICTSRAYHSGAFDEADGSKLGEGYCRRYRLGGTDLLGCGDAVAMCSGSPVLLSQSRIESEALLGGGPSMPSTLLAVPAIDETGLPDGLDPPGDARRGDERPMFAMT